MNDWWREKEARGNTGQLIKITSSTLKCPLVPTTPQHSTGKGLGSYAKRERQKPFCYGIPFFWWTVNWKETDWSQQMDDMQTGSLSGFEPDPAMSCHRYTVCSLGLGKSWLLSLSVDHIFNHSLLSLYTAPKYKKMPLTIWHLQMFVGPIEHPQKFKFTMIWNWG